MTFTLAQINDLRPDEFVHVVGPSFEHSPWIAERMAARRPFPSVDALHAAMSSVVQTAPLAEQFVLIRAHPDLVGGALLTAESHHEQAAAGLGDLSAEEVAAFHSYNQEYQQRFGFPFVICARLNKKDAILAAFPVRLQNSAEEERRTALAEICKIAELRLRDLIVE